MHTKNLSVLILRMRGKLVLDLGSGENEICNTFPPYSTFNANDVQTYFTLTGVCRDTYPYLDLKDGVYVDGKFGCCCVSKP